jgi:hypothetical protein
MHHRVNSVIHLASAFYWALALGILSSVAPFYSLLAFPVWAGTGVGLLGVDLLAGVKQWRSPLSGRVFSIMLHFSVAILIVSLITFEYWQAEPESFLVWFRTNDYWFVAVLAIVRLWAGNALLCGNKDIH